MSDEINTQKPVCGWTKAYHPSGLQVTLPVPAEPLDYASMFTNVSRALESGWLLAAPGLEAGEHKEDIGWVVRREKANDDNTETPIVDLYAANEQMTFKILSVYLNKDEDVTAFEKASGMGLNQIPLFVGTAAPERGANRQTDRFIVKTPRPFGVVMKDNPKYNPDEPDAKKRKPKRLFVRWASHSTTSGSQDTGVPDFADELRKASKDIKALAAVWATVDAAYTEGRIDRDYYQSLAAEKDWLKGQLQTQRSPQQNAQTSTQPEEIPF